MNHEFVDSLSLRLVQALLHFLWQGCAVALVTALAGRLLSRTSAQVRYAAYVAAMVVMVLCLPVTFALLDVPPRGGAEPRLYSSSRPSASHATDGIGVDTAGAKGGSSAAIPPAEERPGPSSRLSEFRALSLIEPYARYVAVGYFLGVTLMMLRLSMALRGGQRLYRSATAVDDEGLVAVIEREVRRMGLKVVPAVAYCERISVPIVVGILKPAILLPWAMTSGLALDQLQALLAHELAHIRRLDLLVNLFQRQAEALLFFHPAVWFISRLVSTEREIAADDRVLAVGWDRVHYANALVRMAELSRSLRRERFAERIASLAAKGSGGSELKRRVLRLIADDDRPTLRLGRAGGTFLFAVLIVIAFTPIFVQAWAPPSGASATQPAAQGPKADSGKSAANSADPHIVIAEHVILWDHHVVTWDQVVKRLRAKRVAGPFHATFLTTNGVHRTKGGEQAYDDRIHKLYRELFEPVGVTYASISPRGSAYYDAIRTAEDTLPNPKFARSGQVVTPEGKPATDAQVIVLPAFGPLTASSVAISGTQLRDPLDEQWVSTDENGQFTVYPREADYLLMVLHPAGYLSQKVPATTQVLRLEPWATITLGSTGDIAEIQATISIWPNGANPGDPWTQIYLNLIKGKSIEIKVPTGQITVSQSLEMGRGVFMSLPADRFFLEPGEGRTVEVKPPSDADRKRAKALYEEMHGPKSMR